MSEDKKLNMPVASASAPDHRSGCSLHPAENGRTDDWTIYELDHHLSVL